MAENYQSDWITVNQVMINEFADLTQDHQSIHIDPVAAAKTPLGGTIAHGFLTLSFLSRFSELALPPFEHPNYRIVSAFNYGFDKIRFLSPVKSGSRIRGCFAEPQWTEKDNGRVLIRYSVIVEIEGEDKPAIVAEWLTMVQVARID